MNLNYSRTASGQLEIRFEDTSLFPYVKDVLLKDWGAREIERLETVDQVWLDLSVKNTALTLHWDEMAGLCLIANDHVGELILQKIGDYLSSISEKT